MINKVLRPTSSRPSSSSGVSSVVSSRDLPLWAAAGEAKKNLSPWCAAKGGAAEAEAGAAARLCAAEAVASVEEEERLGGAAEGQRHRGWEMADTDSARRGQTRVLLPDTRRPTTLILSLGRLFSKPEEETTVFFFQGGF